MLKVVSILAISMVLAIGIGSSAEAAKKAKKSAKVPKAAITDVVGGGRGQAEEPEVVVNQTSPLVRTLGPVKPDTKE